MHIYRRRRFTRGGTGFMASSYNRSRGHHLGGQAIFFLLPRRSFVWLYQDIGSREGAGFSEGFLLCGILGGEAE